MLIAKKLLDTRGRETRTFKRETRDFLAKMGVGQRPELSRLSLSVADFGHVRKGERRRVLSTTAAARSQRGVFSSGASSARGAFLHQGADREQVIGEDGSADQ